MYANYRRTGQMPVIITAINYNLQDRIKFDEKQKPKKKKKIVKNREILFTISVDTSAVVTTVYTGTWYDITDRELFEKMCFGHM